MGWGSGWGDNWQPEHKCLQRLDKGWDGTDHTSTRGPLSGVFSGSVWAAATESSTSQHQTHTSSECSWVEFPVVSFLRCCCFSVYACLPVSLSVQLPTSLSIWLYACVFILVILSFCHPVCPSARLSAGLPVFLTAEFLLHHTPRYTPSPQLRSLS